MENLTIPKCQKCSTGDLVPLSDFGSQGAPIHYKAWVCTNPDCGFNIKIRNGRRLPERAYYQRRNARSEGALAAFIRLRHRSFP